MRFYARRMRPLLTAHAHDHRSFTFDLVDSLAEICKRQGIHRPRPSVKPNNKPLGNVNSTTNQSEGSGNVSSSFAPSGAQAHEDPGDDSINAPATASSSATPKTSSEETVRAASGPARRTSRRTAARRPPSDGSMNGGVQTASEDVHAASRPTPARRPAKRPRGNDSEPDAFEPVIRTRTQRAAEARAALVNTRSTASGTRSKARRTGAK